MLREQRLAEVFVELADSLVAEFDVVEFLHSLAEVTVELLPVDATGIMLADQRGSLRSVASSNDPARLVEEFVADHEEGPCLDAFHSGKQLVNIRLDATDGKWPLFTAAALAAGFSACHVLPLRLRGEVVGAMNLFCQHTDQLPASDVALAQAMADVATIGLLQHRAVMERELLAQQLQTALNSRVLLEQAKGMLAERGHLSVTDAFTTMRTHARRTGQTLTAVATGILDGTITTSTLLGSSRSRAT